MNITKTIAKSTVLVSALLGVTWLLYSVSTNIFVESKSELTEPRVLGYVSANLDDNSFSSASYELISPLLITEDEVIGYDIALPTHTPKAQDTNIESEKVYEIVTCNYSDLTNQFLCLLNNYRAENKTAPLVLDGNMNTAAQGHAEWMDSNNLLSHQGKDKSSFSDRCSAVGTSCSAEAVGNVPGISAQSLLDAWRNSTAHKGILLGNYSYLGVANSGDYATGLFR